MFGQSQTNHHEGPSRVCLGQSGRTEEACTLLAPCSASNSTFWPSCSSCGITGRNSAVRDFSEPVRAAPKDLGGHAAQTWSKGRRSHPIEDSAPPSAGHAGVSYWPRGRWLGDCSQRDRYTSGVDVTLVLRASTPGSCRRHLVRGRNRPVDALARRGHRGDPDRRQYGLSERVPLLTAK